MSPQKFVKEIYPDAKDMYREGGGHAIMTLNSDTGENIVLSYGNTSAKAWANAKANISIERLLTK